MSTRGLSLRTFPSWITIFLFAKKSFSDGKLFTCVSQSVLIMKEDIKGIQGRKGRWGMCCIAESMTGDLLYLFWSQQPGDVSPWCSLVFLLLSYRVMVSTTQDSTVTTILHNATVIHLQTQDMMSNNRKFWVQSNDEWKICSLVYWEHIGDSDKNFVYLS